MVMRTAERILNLVDDLKNRISPDRNRANGVKKTLAVLGIIGSTAAVGYGVYRAVMANNEDQKSLNLD